MNKLLCSCVLSVPCFFLMGCTTVVDSGAYNPAYTTDYATVSYYGSSYNNGYYTNAYYGYNTPYWTDGYYGYGVQPAYWNNQYYNNYY